MNNSGLPDKPGSNEPTSPQQPIFLRAPQEQQPYIQPQQMSPSSQWIPPQDMGGRTLLPNNPVAGTNRSWKNDPAYRVLFIAIGVIVLSSLICVGVLAAMFNQPSSQTAQGGGPNTQQTALNVVRVDTSPTPAATPTPVPTPTPFPTPTPTPTPTQAPAIGPLTVNVVPNPVKNLSTATINITGSTPNAQITVVVTYTNATSFGNNTLSGDANDAGNATIQWQVQVFSITRKTVTAHLQVTASDGQTTQTDVTVTTG